MFYIEEGLHEYDLDNLTTIKHSLRYILEGDRGFILPKVTKWLEDGGFYYEAARLCVIREAFISFHTLDASERDHMVSRVLAGAAYGRKFDLK